MSLKDLVKSVKTAGVSLQDLVGAKAEDAQKLYENAKASVASGYAANSDKHMDVFGYEDVLVNSGSMARQGNYELLLRERLTPDEYPDQTKPIPAMQDYVGVCKGAGDLCLCVPTGLSNVMDNRVLNNLDKYYQNSVAIYYMVSSNEEKIKFIKAYAKVLGIPIKNITVIDADRKLIDLAEGAGMCAAPVSSIVARWELEVLKECEE